MNIDSNELIKQRAYAIWEREGRPDGRHDDHWERASQEMHGLEDAPKTVKKPDHVAPAGEQGEEGSKQQV